jgi:isopenicillin-N epimerase
MMSPAEARRLWRLDPGVRHLNHGGFGACPAPLLAAQTAWRERMERQPTRFFVNELPGLLHAARAALARFLGTEADRLGFVDNATTGMNAVIAAAPLRRGDEVVTTDHVYNAVRLALCHHAARAGAAVVEVPLAMPLRGEAAVVEAVVAAIGPRTRLLVIDHVASASAAVLPVAAVVAAAHARGVPVLVDGAHAPGLVDLDLEAIGAAWYAGNCHKWLSAPRGAGFLAAGADAPWPVHPTVISHAYGQGFAAEFDMQGTRDVTPWLTVPEAVALHEAWGGPALRARNAALARGAARALAGALGTETGAPDAMFAAMATVRLPCDLPADRPTAARLRDALWEAARIEAPVTAVGGALWLRLSAQLYNEAADYEGLAPAVRRILG